MSEASESSSPSILALPEILQLRIAWLQDEKDVCEKVPLAEFGYDPAEHKIKVPSFLRFELRRDRLKIFKRNETQSLPFETLIFACWITPEWNIDLEKDFTTQNYFVLKEVLSYLGVIPFFEKLRTSFKVDENHAFHKVLLKRTGLDLTRELNGEIVLGRWPTSDSFIRELFPIYAPRREHNPTLVLEDDNLFQDQWRTFLQESLRINLRWARSLSSNESLRLFLFLGLVSAFNIPNLSDIKITGNTFSYSIAADTPFILNTIQGEISINPHWAMECSFSVETQTLTIRTNLPEILVYRYDHRYFRFDNVPFQIPGKLVNCQETARILIISYEDRGEILHRLVDVITGNPIKIDETTDFQKIFIGEGVVFVQTGRNKFLYDLQIKTHIRLPSQYKLDDITSIVWTVPGVTRIYFKDQSELNYSREDGTGILTRGRRLVSQVL